jgi:endoglucanase
VLVSGKAWSVVLMVTVLVVGFSSAAPSRAGPASPAVRVVGNQLVNGSGQSLRLLGVDRSGTEYACAQGWGIFDGPSDATSIQAMAAWHVNAVRVPLNEDCWLGLNGVKAAYAGANYRSAIEGYVSRLNAAGLTAVVDLHWSAPGGRLALSQQIMADSDHAPAFWTSVAGAFKGVPGVVFDLYNEPHDLSWSCWRDGCWDAYGWHVAGMQQLVTVVRAAGARQPILVAGTGWAGDLSQWLAYRPSDPLHQLAASVHIYNFSQCDTSSCWNQTLAPVAAAVPLVAGEIGEDDCGPAFINAFMTWADAHHVSYLGWAWDTASCGGGPSLIASYGGTPTAFGAGLRNHLAALAGT